MNNCMCLVLNTFDYIEKITFCSKKTKKKFWWFVFELEKLFNFAKTKIVTQDPRSVDFCDTLREGTSLVPRYLHFSQPDWKNFDYYVRKLANYLNLTLLSLYYALALMLAESITFCV